MLAVSQAGNKIFRSNVGKVQTIDGRWFDTGLPKGHADLYGFRPDGQVFCINLSTSFALNGCIYCKYLSKAEKVRDCA